MYIYTLSWTYIESLDFECLYYLPFAFILYNMTVTTAALHLSLSLFEVIFELQLV